MNFYRKIKKQISPNNIFEKAKENPRFAFFLVVVCIIAVYAFFNSNGIYQRIKLENQKKEVLEKIQIAEEERKKLQEQSKALDGDKKAIEKVAREKYGMVREGEKVYKVTPKK
jgi:cell division protein FtsB